MIRCAAGRLVCVLALCLAASQAAVALDDATRQLLKQELVVERGQSYEHLQFNLCRVRLARGPGDFSPPFRVERHIEAPTSLLSRDRFVSISTRIIVVNRLALAKIIAPDSEPSEMLGAVQCQPESPPKETADFVIHIEMRSEGVEVRIRDTDSSEKSVDVLAWKDLLGS